MLVHWAQHTAIGIVFNRVFILISVQRDVTAPTPPTENPRASRRCTPLQKRRMKRVTDHVDAHLSRRITLADMAAAAGLTRMHFAAQFRAATGMRPHDFVLQRRIERAQEQSRTGAGRCRAERRLSDPGPFYHCFQALCRRDSALLAPPSVRAPCSGIRQRLTQAWNGPAPNCIRMVRKWIRARRV